MGSGLAHVVRRKTAPSPMDIHAHVRGWTDGECLATTMGRGSTRAARHSAAAPRVEGARQYSLVSNASKSAILADTGVRGSTSHWALRGTIAAPKRSGTQSQPLPGHGCRGAGQWRAQYGAFSLRARPYAATTAAEKRRVVASSTPTVAPG